MIKKIIPKSIKKQFWVIHKLFKYSLLRKTYAIPNDLTSLNFLYSISLEQKLKTNKTSEAKNINLKIAVNKIEKVTIYPNQIFSFWKIVGNPTKNNGFVESRSIVNDEIVSSLGGGLCQLSGLIYYLGLKAGLEIIERFPHSADIYNEQTRFTPLGSDATVVYWHKDLRLRNNLDTPISFSFDINSERIKISINSDVKIIEQSIDFFGVDLEDNKVKIKTFKNKKLVQTDVYIKNEAV